MTLRNEEGYFSASDGTKIFYRLWDRDAPNACVLLHGYGDHSGRYAELVELVADLPFCFYSFDLRGQGKSEGRRVFADSLNDYVTDCYDFVNFLDSRFKVTRKKFFLFGHSFGGSIAVRVAERDSTRWNGLLLSSPCFQLCGIAWLPITRFFVKLLARVVPRMILRNLVEPRFLFHDAERLKNYRKDSLIERRVTAHLAFEIIKGCLLDCKRRVRLNMPVWVLAGGDDRIVSLSEAKKWFNRLQAVEKRMVVYPNLYHEIFNEIERAKPVEDFRKFLGGYAGGVS